MSIDAASLNAEFAGKHPSEIIAKAVELADGGNIIVSTNFRPQEAVILDLCTKVKSDITVVWADSGYMMEETYRFADKVIEQLKLNVKVYNPQMTSARRDALYGPVPGLESEEELEAFADLVKLEPFRRALAEEAPKVWISGIRKEQNPFRDTLETWSVEGDGLIKVNPVFEWTNEEMESYLSDNSLPDETIYFDPTKISEKRECGLHKPNFLK